MAPGAKGLRQMAERECCGISGCGWLLLIMGLFAAGVGLLAWLIRLEIDPADSGNETVWTTSAGTHYHRRECRALARSQPHAVTLQEAVTDGLEPCDLCKPPV